MHNELVKCFILAGGKSSRMGSNKALLTFNGNTLLSNCIKVLKEFSKEIYISGNYPEYKIFNLPIIIDEYAEIGPMGGLQSSLKILAKDEYGFFTTCDMPLIKSSLINKLATELNPFDCVVFSVNGIIQPLFGFYNQRCLRDIESQIQKGNFSLTSLVFNSHSKVIEISSDEKDYLNNINTPEEYKKLNQNEY